jgi:hypothetical protein
MFVHWNVFVAEIAEHKHGHVHSFADYAEATQRVDLARKTGEATTTILHVKESSRVMAARTDLSVGLGQVVAVLPRTAIGTRDIPSFAIAGGHRGGGGSGHSRSRKM